MNRDNSRDKVLEMIEEDLLSSEHMLMCCLKYMSNADIWDMAQSNEICLGCGDFHNCTCDQEQEDIEEDPLKKSR